MAEFIAFNTRLFVCSEIVLAKGCVSASDWQQSRAGPGSEGRRVPARLPGIQQAGSGSAEVGRHQICVEDQFHRTRPPLLCPTEAEQGGLEGG